MFKMILAIDSKNGIGKDNKLNWHLKSDLKRFRELTINQNVIMGYNTFKSIGKPLPSRSNIVLSRDESLRINGVKVYNSIESLLKSVKDGWVIGGAEIYKQMLQYTDEIYMTRINKDMKCDISINLDLKNFMIIDKQVNHELITDSQGMKSFVSFEYLRYKRVR